MKSNLNDTLADEFLNAQTKEGTFSTYKCQLKQYLQWTGKTGEQLIAEKKADKDFQVETTFFAYRKYLLNQGKSENFVFIAKSLCKFRNIIIIRFVVKSAFCVIISSCVRNEMV